MIKKNSLHNKFTIMKTEGNDLNEFVKICRLDDLKENVGKRFMVDDVDVALFKVNGNVHAVSNVCPHQKAAMIYDGFIEDGKIVCPLHGWEFNLKDGTMGEGRRGLDCYDVKIEGNDVYIKVFKHELNW